MKMNEDLEKINLCNIIQIISIVMFLAQFNQVFNWISVDIKHGVTRNTFSPQDLQCTSTLSSIQLRWSIKIAV